jgi:hypothetical protein
MYKILDIFIKHFFTGLLILLISSAIFLFFFVSHYGGIFSLYFILFVRHLAIAKHRNFKTSKLPSIGKKESYFENFRKVQPIQIVFVLSLVLFILLYNN